MGFSENRSRVEQQYELPFCWDFESDERNEDERYEHAEKIADELGVDAFDLLYEDIRVYKAAQSFVHDDEVTSVSLTPDGRRAVSASVDRSLKVWDIEKGELLGTWFGDHAMESCAIDSSGRLIVGGDRVGRVHILRLR